MKEEQKNEILTLIDGAEFALDEMWKNLSELKSRIQDMRNELTTEPLDEF